MKYSDIDPFNEENWEDIPCECELNDERRFPSKYLNYGRTHIGYCEKCNKKWIIGSNLFSSWRYENQDIWNKNLEFLERFLYTGA
jgi:hypothetical protein